MPIKCITLETVIHNCRVSENPRLDSIDALKSIAAKSLSEHILSYICHIEKLILMETLGLYQV